tara:strand:+ start:39 stop:341 length:303 start_codon:yes stop_codon:yes gene_type:complete
MLNNDLVIERIEEAIKTTQAFTQFDDSYNRTSLKTLEKLETALIFAKNGGVGVCVLRDEVIIDGKYIATLYNKKWKVKGTRKWYPYGNPLDLLHKLRGTV